MGVYLRGINRLLVWGGATAPLAKCGYDFQVRVKSCCSVLVAPVEVNSNGDKGQRQVGRGAR